jgi:transposase-like protein
MDTDPIVTELDAEPRKACTSTLQSGRGASIELITRGDPRRPRSTEQKHAIAAESLSPGASPTKVAGQHGISAGLPYTWREALLAAQPRLARGSRAWTSPQVQSERNKRRAFPRYWRRPRTHRFADPA